MEMKRIRGAGRYRPVRHLKLLRLLVSLSPIVRFKDWTSTTFPRTNAWRDWEQPGFYNRGTAAERT